MLFIETSALDSTNVDVAFEKAITKIYENVKTSKRESLKNALTGTKRGKCDPIGGQSTSRNSK